MIWTGITISLNMHCHDNRAMIWKFYRLTKMKYLAFKISDGDGVLLLDGGKKELEACHPEGHAHVATHHREGHWPRWEPFFMRNRSQIKQVKTIFSF